MNEESAPEVFAKFITKDNYFIKHTYSALKQSELRGKLEGYDELDLCGADTDACILATAYDAFDQNFTVTILFDLCQTRNNELQMAAEQIIKRNIQK